MNHSELIESKYVEAASGLSEDMFTSTNDRWYQYVIDLPIDLRATYLIVVLENQVLNGGFHQYFVNGYGQFAKEAANALTIIGAKRKAEILRDAYTAVNPENSSHNEFRHKLLRKEIEALFVNDDLVIPLELLDDRYCSEESEDIFVLLGNYLHNLSRDAL
jgi:Domain of unknown function (DUF4375)